MEINRNLSEEAVGSHLTLESADFNKKLVWVEILLFYTEDWLSQEKGGWVKNKSPRKKPSEEKRREQEKERGVIGLWDALQGISKGISGHSHWSTSLYDWDIRMNPSIRDTS